MWWVLKSGRVCSKEIGIPCRGDIMDKGMEVGKHLRHIQRRSLTDILQDAERRKVERE